MRRLYHLGLCHLDRKRRYRPIACRMAGLNPVRTWLQVDALTIDEPVANAR